MSKRILILGVNGFIGSHLLTRILNQTDWEVFGLDLSTHKIETHLNHPRFHFKQADLRAASNWVQHTIQQVDTVLPLVAIANPHTYVADPLSVYELDFEANIPIIRWCAQYQKHLIFPSTSEVYGMCQDETFDEYQSNLILGPTSTPRWIYSCSKQLLDRVILALNQRNPFPFTLFRPFNWFGPGLDEMGAHVQTHTRVVTQFINQMLRGEDLFLVDGGLQTRSFTYIDDGIDALMLIINNAAGTAHQQIFNIGNPNNHVSIAILADTLISVGKTFPSLKPMVDDIKIIVKSAKDVFGEGYQDIMGRVPSIAHAEKKLGYSPKISLAQGLQNTLQAIA